MTHEAKRLKELRKYNILDSLTEKDYEDVTFLAAVICDVPIALISFVDGDRQWFKSHRGLPGSETSREYSFCSHAIEIPDEVMIVEDSRIDERFRNNPLVTGDPGIVFYAGVSLVNKEGFGLGTVCIIDTKTRTLTESQITALKFYLTR
jgi:GAF domain-containing protein